MRLFPSAISCGSMACIQALRVSVATLSVLADRPAPHFRPPFPRTRPTLHGFRASPDTTTPHSPADRRCFSPHLGGPENSQASRWSGIIRKLVMPGLGVERCRVQLNFFFTLPSSGAGGAGYAEGHAATRIPDPGRQGDGPSRIPRNLGVCFRMTWMSTHPSGNETIKFHQGGDFSVRSTKATHGRGHIQRNSRQGEPIDRVRTLHSYSEKQPDGIARHSTPLARRLRHHHNNSTTDGRSPR